MKVAVVGSGGYISGFLIRALAKDKDVEQILKIDQYSEADVFLNLEHSEQFDYATLDKTDYIIFTAAISSPDRCANEFELCQTINVIGTKYFIGEAIKRGCNVLFFSSDAVYGDIPGQVYTEKSDTHAETPYGRMKKSVEDEFKTDTHFKAIRLSYVVSAKDKFVSYCLDCIKNGKVADIFHPFYRNCVTVSDVTAVVLWFLHHWKEYEDFVLNVAGTELVSRVRIADELNRMTGGRLLYSISKPNGEFYQNRPAITQMKSLYLDKYKIIDSGSFTEKIMKELENIQL